ncbi:MAG: hypothetical protein HY286_04715 [Planctomycetes bacterium]|nr:hypothetical protein [Planctomycetota bacterium]
MIKFTLIFFGAVLLAALVVSACIRRIAPDEIGMHTTSNLLWIRGGLDPQDYDAGFYRSIWPFERWETLPRSTQRIAFTNRPDLRGPNDAAAIEAKTLDGDRVTIEAAVLVKIAPGKGHIVFEKVGAGDALRALARDLAKPPIVTVFGTLKTQDIYNAEVRRKAYQSLTTTTLTQLLASNGLELVDVSIMEVTYDPQYEAQLQRQKESTQKTLLEVSQQKLVTEEGEKKKLMQGTDNEVQDLKTQLLNKKLTLKAINDMAIAVLDAESLKRVGEIEADAKQYRGEKEAMGIQANKEAEANAVQLQKDAYGENGANVVAYLAAQNFSVKSVTMPSFGIDWFSPLSIAQHMGAVLESAGVPGQK